VSFEHIFATLLTYKAPHRGELHVAASNTATDTLGRTCDVGAKGIRTCAQVRSVCCSGRCWREQEMKTLAFRNELTGIKHVCG
jgi:hypothetical protein